MSHPTIEEEGIAAPVPSSTPITETESPTVIQTQTPPQSDRPSVITSIATCGFISGNPEYPITCHKGDSCGHDPEQKLVACCKDPVDGICAVSTRCLDRTMSALENMLGGRDLVCRDSRAPLCKTDILQGEPDLDGYSLFICDTDKVGEVIIPFTTSSRVSTGSSTDEEISTLTSGGDQTGSPSSTVDPASHKPSVGMIVGAVLGSIGGVAAVIAGIMLLRELKKKRGQQHRTFSGQQQREDASRQNYQLVDIQQRPAELPDSPTTVDGQTVSPISPVSPLSPLSPLSMNQVGTGGPMGGNDARS